MAIIPLAPFQAMHLVTVIAVRAYNLAESGFSSCGLKLSYPPPCRAQSPVLRRGDGAGLGIVSVKITVCVDWP